MGSDKEQFKNISGGLVSYKIPTHLPHMESLLFHPSRVGSFPGYKPAKMGSFDYLERSTRPLVLEIRAIIESWASSIPEFARHHWRTRFRSPDEATHLGAFSELLTYKILDRFRLRPRFIEPTAFEHTPDFGAVSGETEIWVEAITKFGESESARRHASFAEQLIEGLEGIGSSWFQFYVDFDGHISSAPAIRPIRHQIQNWLKTLNRERMQGLLQEKEALPYWERRKFDDQMRLRIDLPNYDHRN
jgi:hypothetical protein